MGTDAFSVNWNNYNFYAFPPFRFIIHALQKIQCEQSTGIIIIPNWKTQIFFPIAMKLLIDLPILIKPRKKNLILPKNSKAIHPLHRKMGLLACRDIGRPCESKQISEKAQTLISHSWRGSTSKQYDVYIQKWKSYCCERNIDPVTTSITNGVNFLASLFYEQNLGYSAINTARSALSTVFPLQNNCTFGQNHIVKRLLRGVFNQRPALPKYSCTWDVNIVLNYIKGMSSNDMLSLPRFDFQNCDRPIIEIIIRSKITNFEINKVERLVYRRTTLCNYIHIITPEAI